MVRSRDDVIDSCHLTIYYHQVAHPEDRARETKGGLYGAVSPSGGAGGRAPGGEPGGEAPTRNCIPCNGKSVFVDTKR